MIWSHTIRPRRLEISTDWRYYDDPRSKINTEFPALLHVCKESRSLGLETYKKCCCEMLRCPFYLSVFDTIHFGDYTAILNFEVSESDVSDSELESFQNIIAEACVNFQELEALKPVDTTYPELQPSTIRKERLYHYHLVRRLSENKKRSAKEVVKYNK